MRVRNRLAEVRQQRGLSAATLAAQAGIRRQTVYAIESGSYVPNTLVGLRLARALEVAVEELFSVESKSPTSQKAEKVDLLFVEGGDPLHSSQPGRLCRVGGRLIGVSSRPILTELPAADGVYVGADKPRGATVQPFCAEEDFGKRLLIAGCDPAVSVLARHLARQGGVELITAGCSSFQALQWLKEKKIHIAGTHLRDGATERSNLAVVKKFFPKGAVRMVTFALWEEGLVVAKGNPKRILGIGDLARKDVTLINREVGAGSRFLLDCLLKEQGITARKARGYDQVAYGHIPAAWHVRSGKADCCMATQAAALLFGLDFLPLAGERYDLVIPERYFGLQAVQALLDVMNRSALRRELEALGGYDTSQTGRMLT